MASNTNTCGFRLPWWAVIPTLMLCVPIATALGPQLTNIFLVYFGFRFICHFFDDIKNDDRNHLTSDRIKDALLNAMKETMEDVKNCFFYIADKLKAYLPTVQCGDVHGLRAVEVKELPESFYAEIDLPGVEKEGINLQTEGYNVDITANRKRAQREGEQPKENPEAPDYHYSFVIPELADMNTVMAKCENGVLTITVQKKVQFRNGKKNVVIK